MRRSMAATGRCRPAGRLAAVSPPATGDSRPPRRAVRVRPADRRDRHRASSRSSSSRPTTTPQLAHARRRPRRARPTSRGSRCIDPQMVDTAKYKKDRAATTSASRTRRVNNPWRQVGLKTMQAEVELHKEITRVHRASTPRARTTSRSPTSADLRRQGLRRADRLAEHHRDADPGRRGGLQGQAAGHRVRPWRQHRLPGDVHQPDRRLRASVHDGGRVPQSRRCKPGGKILALRILPGVDVLETRWSAAKVDLRQERASNVVGVEFTDGDPAKTKSDRRRLHPAVRHDRRRLDGRRRDRRRGGRGVRGRGPARAADQRRGPARLPEEVEGREA